MSRYIDADALKENCYKKMDELMESTSEHLSVEALSLLCGFTLIDSAPSIDIEPKRGEWIYTNNTLRVCDEWECDQCGNISFEKTNFCDRCGADMREREGE